ncbi:hypothetical protein MKX03_000082 [Papaver bracteatum]|nr:hypothetical protein MKX03_000082 [Papaver bracteatum]
MWLYGLEFPGTIMVFMDKQIHFFCSQKKPLLQIFSRLFQSLVIMAPYCWIHCKKAPEGNLLELWSDKLKTSSLQLANVTNKRCSGTCKGQGEADICYPPIFQSGGELDLRPNASSNEEKLYYDSASVIIRVVGSCYNSYCLNVARTFLIDANAICKEAAIGALKAGSKVSAALAVVEKDQTTRRCWLGGGSGAGNGRSVAKPSSDLIAYNNVNDVPFHVATVKSVNTFIPHDANSLKFHGAIYLKEVSFRSKYLRHISEVVVSRESERAERASLVTQEKLRLAALVNGFRCSTSKPDERVDIMYGNFKHAFFQPAEKDMITLLHFHLHNHSMVGTKKTKDVQGGGRRSDHDPHEIEEEQQERDRKNRINMDFSNFFRGMDLEFDQPLRELSFRGVPFKGIVLYSPLLVVSLNEIEIANLESVGLHQKNFYMAIVKIHL